MRGLRSVGDWGVGFRIQGLDLGAFELQVKWHEFWSDHEDYEPIMDQLSGPGQINPSSQ